MKIDLFEDEQRIFDEAKARIEAVKGGATYDFEDYITITKEYGRLLRQLRRSTRIADRTTIGLHRSNLNLSDKVRYDTLTGIYSRRYLEESLESIVRFMNRSGSKLSVLMIDIDYFKKYNDTYGHSEGDVCLKAVAEAFAGSLSRAEDFVARYGGEEFVAVLPDTDEKGALVVANKILEDVMALKIPHEKNEVADCITVSIGGTTGGVGSSGGADFIRRADEALYLSKQRGRNRYTYMRFEEDNV